MSNFESVRKFMKTFGQEVKEKAEFPNDKITSLRFELIQEELGELKDAIDKKDTYVIHKERFKTSLIELDIHFGFLQFTIYLR